MEARCLPLDEETCGKVFGKNAGKIRQEYRRVV